jgi:O-antigen ligase
VNISFHADPAACPTVPSPFPVEDSDGVRTLRSGPEFVRSPVKRRQVLILLALALGTTFLLYSSTISSLGQESSSTFTSVESFDPLARFKLLARAVAVLLAVCIAFVTRLTWKDVIGGGVTWLILFFALAATSAVYSALPIVTLTRALSFAGVLFFGVILVRAFDRLGVIRPFWDGLYICYAIFVILTFIVSLLSPGAFQGEVVHRLGGVFGAANKAGAVAAIGAVWSFVRISRRRSVPLALVAATAAAAVLVLSVSRGAIAATLVTCLLYASYRKQILRAAVILGAIGLGGILASYLGAFITSEDLQVYATRGQSWESLLAMTGRVPLYTYLLTEQFPEHPWMGVGFQMLSESSLSTDVPTAVVIGGRGYWQASHAHNSIIHVLIGNGVIGLTLYLMGLWGVAKSISRQIRSGPSYFDEAGVLLLVAFLNSLVDTSLTSTIDASFISVSFVCGLSLITAGAHRNRTILGAYP